MNAVARAILAVGSACLLAGCGGASPAISEQEAHDLVWEIPRVQDWAHDVEGVADRPIYPTAGDHEESLDAAGEARQRMVHAVSRTVARPGGPLAPGPGHWTIAVGEAHGTVLTRWATFRVDTRTGEVAVQPFGEQEFVPLEGWR